MREAGEKKYDIERSSSRQSIPEVLVELRRNIDSETPDWVGSAVDIALGGMFLELPPEAGLGDLFYVTFTLGDPRTSFRRLGAVVLSRRPRGEPLPRVRTGDLGVLGFTAWPLEKEYELEAWLREHAA